MAFRSELEVLEWFLANLMGEHWERSYRLVPGMIEQG
jgi:hypothetical protein